PSAALDAMTDVCSGWRAGGRAMSSVARGEGIPLQDCPPAPDLTAGDGGADDLSWHDMAPLPPGAMRRRRRIDLGSGDPIELDGMFRDSYGEPDGTEVVLHEYGVRATLSADGLVVRSIEASPAVLPFVECPLAAAQVGDLVGQPIGEFRTKVREELSGIRSCT